MRESVNESDVRSMLQLIDEMLEDNRKVTIIEETFQGVMKKEFNNGKYNYVFEISRLYLSSMEWGL